MYLPRYLTRGRRPAERTATRTRLGGAVRRDGPPRSRTTFSRGQLSRHPRFRGPKAIKKIEPFSATLPADPAVLFDFRQSLRNWLQTAQLGPDVQGRLCLQSTRPSQTASSTAVVQPSLSQEVRRTAIWSSRSRQRDRGEPGSEPDGALAERGRGLALKRGLSDELEVFVDDGCVTIRLRRSGTWSDRGYAAGRCNWRIVSSASGRVLARARTRSMLQI
jgi:hypothetical protein